MQWLAPAMGVIEFLEKKDVVVVMTAEFCLHGHCPVECDALDGFGWFY